MSLLSQYLERVGDRSPDPAPAALYAMLDHIATVSPSVAAAIVHEFSDQRTNLKLIASEHYCSLATQFAQGTLFTDKYAEGYPAHRFYAGWDNVDDVESEAALLAGYSAYSRKIDFAKMREIADEVGAVLMVDMAHFAGLVAGGVFEGNYNPVPFAHVVTTTTHKTLRGPRGGMILCTSEFAEAVDKGCPIILGGPLPHVLAAKAVALREASQPSFRDYARRIVENARALAEACVSEGMDVLTGGTDNHLLLIDVHRSFGLTGRQAESAIRSCHMTLNRNALPFDANGPWYTSGLRVGTPAATTLGMTPADMREIAAVFKLVLANAKAATVQKGADAGQQSRARFELAPRAAEAARERVAALLGRYPVYPEIDLDLLGSAARDWGGTARPVLAVRAAAAVRGAGRCDS